MRSYGCSSWALTAPPYDDRGDHVFAAVAGLGFDEIELPVLTPRDATSLVVGASALRESADKHGLQVGRLSLFAPVTQSLIADRDDTSAKCPEALAEVFELADILGTTRVTVRAPWPDGVTVPTLTPPEYFYINVPDMPGPGYVEADYHPDWRYETKFRVGVPDDVDWSAQFERFVAGLDATVTTAAEHGVTIELENQYGTLVPHTDSLLRVFDRLPRLNLVASLNVTQAFLQREVVPWSIRKLNRQLGHLRVADGDGLACYNLPPGSGTLDFVGIAEALADIAFDGPTTCTWLNDIAAGEHLGAARTYLAQLSGSTD